jgi:hypothetical protein
MNISVYRSPPVAKTEIPSGNRRRKAGKCPFSVRCFCRVPKITDLSASPLPALLPLQIRRSGTALCSRDTSTLVPLYVPYRHSLMRSSHRSDSAHRERTPQCPVTAPGNCPAAASSSRSVSTLAVAPVQHVPDRSPPRRVHLFLGTPLKRIGARLRLLRTLFRLAARRTPVRKPRLVRLQLKLFSTNNARPDRETHRRHPCAVAAASCVFLPFQ